MRCTFAFPELILSDDIKDIDQLDESYFQIKNYQSYDKLSAPMNA